MNLLQKILERKILLANLGLFLILVVGATYLLVGVNRFNPLQDNYTLRVEMDRSGGLQPNGDVTVRGLRVGKVTSIKLTENGVEAEAQIHSDTKIPAGSKVAVGALSAAGEQYIDFRPESDSGPYLSNGDVIPMSDTKTPVPITNVLDNLVKVINQVHPDKINRIVNELDVALKGGPNQARSIVEGAELLLQATDDTLPRTRDLILNMRVVIATTTMVQPDLQTLVNNSSTLFDSVKAANSEIGRLLDGAPGQLGTIGGVINDNMDPLTQLTATLGEVARGGRLRTPALTALFPSLLGGATALQTVARDDGKIHVLAGIWPRETCEYSTIPKSPFDTSDKTVPLYNYCYTDNPTLQVRGSANAPRPIIPDNTIGPPPGATGQERSTPPN